MKKIEISLKYLLLFLFIFIALMNTTLMEIYKGILLNTNLVVLFATLMAGLFGFVIAVIPFAIQLFNQDYKNNKFRDEFDHFVIPLLRRFTKILNIMLYFFIFISLLHLVQTIDIKPLKFLEKKYYSIELKEYLFLSIFYIYIIFIVKFFNALKNIIMDLDTMISIFIKEKRKDLK